MESVEGAGGGAVGGAVPVAVVGRGELAGGFWRDFNLKRRVRFQPFLVEKGTVNFVEKMTVPNDFGTKSIGIYLF